MKVATIKKQILYRSILSFVLVLFIVAVYLLYKNLDSSLYQEYEKINKDVDSIKERTLSIETKAKENQKYMDLWAKIDDKKKSFESIKIDEVNKIIAGLAIKYSISNQTLKISLPETLPQSTYNNETILLVHAPVELSFSSYHDVKALQFVDDFINSLHGYVVITNLELIKEKDYVEKDFYNISKGEAVGNIKGRVKFSWYTYKEAPPKPVVDLKDNANLPINEIR